MTDPALKLLKAIAANVRQATTDRDNEIRKALAAGLPLRAVAEAASLSVAGVAKIRDKK